MSSNDFDERKTKAVGEIEWLLISGYKFFVDTSSILEYKNERNV